MAGYQGLKTPEHVRQKISDTFKRKRLTSLYIVGRLIPGQRLKEHLVNDGFKIDECEVCHTGPIWNGRKLVLELDHVNGDRTDNQIKNLRIICPNCHSQTDTYKWKNSKTIKPYRVSIRTIRS